MIREDREYSIMSSDMICAKCAISKAYDWGETRMIVLTNFNGYRGLNLTLPADEQTGIFVLEEKTSSAQTRSDWP